MSGTTIRENPEIGAHFSSRKTAKMIGVEVSTLRKWRAKGEGPQGWIRLKQNVVVYPIKSIRDFMALKQGTTVVTDPDRLF